MTHFKRRNKLLHSLLSRLAWAVLTLLAISPALAEFEPLNNTEKDALIRVARASHFLSQASMGGTVAEIDALAARIEAIGYMEACEEWIDTQLAMPRGPTLLSDVAGMLNVDGTGYSGNSSIQWWDYAWYKQAVQNEDQLRFRMGYALSQICVVSHTYWNGLYRSRFKSHVKYYDRLLDVSFTDHRNLLTNITYSPMMGVWLSHAQNSKGDPELGIFPDENYAREILQLFSMGVYAQRPNGEFLLDFNNKPIENYDNGDILEFAQVFTGLSIQDRRGFSSKNLTLIGNYPLKMEQDFHDTSEKHLLNGFVIPANQDGDDDITSALDNIAQHPSTAPNFSRLLIKRFTSSNPSSDYMQRVNDAWHGKGKYAGEEEGGFQAVLKAILLDPEARYAVDYVEADGKIRAVSVNPMSAKIKEPILKKTQFLRFALAETTGPSDGNLRLGADARAHGQPILGATTVFNFYDADFAPSSGPVGYFVEAQNTADPYNELEIVAPEAQILGQNVVEEFEKFYAMLKNDSGLRFTRVDTEYVTELKQITRIKEGEFADDEALLKHLDAYLCHGLIPFELVTALQTNLNTAAGTDDENLALVLSAIYASPAYSVAP